MSEKPDAEGYLGDPKISWYDCDPYKWKAQRDEAQGLLASIADTINSWCREANYSECHEYLTYALRDHIMALWGSLNHKNERVRVQRDALLAAAKNVCARIRNNGYVFANGSPSALGEVRHDVVKYLEILQTAVKEVEG